MKTYIEVQWQFEALHRWPDAPHPVEYLRNLHRHVFYCRARVEVFHNERELEFIMLKHRLQARRFRESEVDSCETMAHRIVAYLNETYPGRKMTVSVSEDNENSAIVTNEK